MPPKTQDEITALRLQQAKAQVALARANVEKLEAERVAKEAALRRAEAAEKEAEQAKQPKKRTPTKPRSGGVAAGEERTEKATDAPCTPCRKAKAICRYYTSGRSAACVRCQEKKLKCEGGSPPVGVRVKKRKTHDMVDSDLEDETPMPKKKKKVEEAPKAGPSKGKERAHPELEPEPEVEKARPKKIAVAEGSLDTRDLFLRVLQEVSACRSEIRKLRPDMVSLQEEMSELQDELKKTRVEEARLRMEIRKLDHFQNRAGAVEAYFARFKPEEFGGEEDAEGEESATGQEVEESGENSRKAPEKEGEGEGSGKSPEGTDGQESGKELEKAGVLGRRVWEGAGGPGSEEVNGVRSPDVRVDRKN
ncbi:hypothetical protein OH76DRAFT_1490769 [Lentinus brumalis]|uniref:Zn(2)-C6 fungal-type domain-containing protein n=1 Tax=Lentinus brumalis TaxID=2498619 RepID=A0A371CHY3_9APHY|nr:hypothetical protein OH76DRAFT_1490769 [Polyporus brumalis]